MSATARVDSATEGVDTVVHAYGVVREPADLPEVGIGGTPLRTLAVGDLSVVLGDLPALQYGEAAWAEHGQDPHWLRSVAVAHHAVLQHLVERGDVLPLRLPGIHLDDRAFLVALEASRESVERAWRFLEGHVEWSVQVCGHAQALVVDAYATLSREATASAVLGPHDPAVAGSEEPLALHSAHLVPRLDESQFLGVAAELQHELLEAGGLHLEVTGPWPAYDFVDAVEARADGPAGMPGVSLPRPGSTP